MRKLLEHHQNWLDAHDTKSQGWLEDRLADGFNVHHIDGNHDNNHADNLVLIEAGDHSRLHHGDKKLGYLNSHKRERGFTERTLLRGKYLYEQSAFRKKGCVTARVQDDRGVWCDYHHARSYAKHFKLPWPPPKANSAAE